MADEFRTLMVREPAGVPPAVVVDRVLAKLTAYLAEHPLGRLYTPAMGFMVERPPGGVRAPDIAFVKADRLPVPPPSAFPALAPDLAVDVLTPEQWPKEILERVTQWLRAGTDVVWVFEPQRSVGRIYRREGTEEFIAADGAMRGEELLPGLVFPLTDVFHAG